MLVLYVICCFQGITKYNKSILEINSGVLLDFGAGQDLLLRKGQVWRLFTASVLHMNLLHITMNMICFIFLLSRLEKTYRVGMLVLILLGSAVAGNYVDYRRKYVVCFV